MLLYDFHLFLSPLFYLLVFHVDLPPVDSNFHSSLVFLSTRFYLTYRIHDSPVGSTWRICCDPRERSPLLPIYPTEYQEEEDPRKDKVMSKGKHKNNGSIKKHARPVASHDRGNDRHKNKNDAVHARKKDRRQGKATKVMKITKSKSYSKEWGPATKPTKATKDKSDGKEWDRSRGKNLDRRDAICLALAVLML